MLTSPYLKKPPTNRVESPSCIRISKDKSNTAQITSTMAFNNFQKLLEDKCLCGFRDIMHWDLPNRSRSLLTESCPHFINTLYIYEP